VHIAHSHKFGDQAHSPIETRRTLVSWNKLPEVNHPEDY